MVLPEFRLESYFAIWEFKARYNLAASDAETLSLPDLLQMAQAADRARWNELRLGYIPTEGSDPLRDVISQTYEQIRVEDVLCFAGAEEGLYCAMHALLSPDDHAIVVTPNYQSTESVPRSICEVSGVPLKAEHGWSLDVDDVRAALRPNTKMLAVNFPNNPTGKILSQTTFRMLVDICAERGIYLFSDEVYRGIERDPAKRLPQAADIYDRALSLNVMSKAYGLPGLRIGWIACRDRELLSKLERAKHYTSICNSGPSEVLALIALRARDRVLARNRRIVADNLPLFEAFFTRYPELFEWAAPHGG